MNEELKLKGAELYDLAIQLSGLCDVLRDHACETISCGDFKNAIDLSWSYSCVSSLAKNLAEKLSDIAP
jgi:hypothetical protein